MEGNFNFKNLKPTLSEPSKQGKQTDTYFKKQMKPTGMNLKEEEKVKKQDSLKKRIFKLDKMETFVHSDEFLSKEFEKLKGGDDPALKWGYHWNEVLLNILFNDFVLNNANNLQKYKATRPVPKKRRGEEGVKELQKDLQKEKEVSDNAGDRKDDIVADLKESTEDYSGVYDYANDNVEALNDELKANGIEFTYSPLDNLTIIAAKDGAKAYAIMQKNYSVDKLDQEVIDGDAEAGFGLGDCVKIEKSEQIDELFGFGKDKMNIPLPVNKRSKNDTYFVDTNAKKLLGVVAASMSPEEKETVMSKFVGKPNVKQLSWYNAAKMGIKGVPTEVEDGSMQAMDQEFAKKYPQGIDQMVSLAEKKKSDDDKYIYDADGNFVAKRIDSLSDIVLHEGVEEGKLTSSLPVNHSTFSIVSNIAKHVPAEYTENDLKNIIDQYFSEHRMNFKKLSDEDFWEDVVYFLQHDFGKKKIDGIATETTGAAGSGSFAPSLDETTTSASSGQYSGTAIWAKSPESSRFAKKPAYKGGAIIGESVINGDMNYMTEASSFKKYIIKNEIIDMLNESVQEGESFKQHSERMLNKLKQYSQETPELNNDKDFSELMSTYTKRATTGKADDTQGTIPTKKEVSEHHLTDINDKIEFIVTNSPDPELAKERLAVMSDDEIDSTYQNIEREMGINEANQNFLNAIKKDLKNTGNKVPADASAESLQSQDGLFKGKWDTNESYEIVNDKNLDSMKDNFLPPSSETNEGIFGNSQPAWNPETINHVIDNFKMSPDSEPYRNKFVQAKDYLKTKVGQIARLPQLKMWLDQNMPLLSNQVSTLWTNWDLMPTNKLSESKGAMKVNEKQYKEIFKMKLQKSGKSLTTMSANEKKILFEEVDVTYKQKIQESIIDDQPDSMINKSGTSMANTMDSDEINSDGQPAAIAPVATGGVVEGSADEPAYYHSGGEDAETIQDAQKFRQMLKAKYGVDSVSDLSNAERLELMKSMNFSGDKKETPSMDFTQFNSSDDEKAAFQARDQKRLDYLANHADQIMSIEDYQALANAFKAETGENMHHPMAILASIKHLPQDSPIKNKLKNLETIFRSQMKENEQINEDRKTSSQLNVEKLGKENAKNFKTDLANADGVDQKETYPDEGIIKSKVYPNPKDFYIEQDLDKVQKEAKSAADLEREALERSNGGQALKNIGDATADGTNIPKRNLTKDEAYALAMNRGRGMQDIVYDNKPSEKFEERMKQDMGKEVYQSRQDKIEYQKDAPMYNKDTQPTETGNASLQDNKFKKGYNSESVTAKYKDEYGKFKIFEFFMKDVVEATTIIEESIKLSLDGLGNKYTFVGKTINENAGFEDVMNAHDFYLHENKVYAIEKAVAKKPVNEAVNKMKHLMNYKPSNYVDTKKSVKY